MSINKTVSETVWQHLNYQIRNLRAQGQCECIGECGQHRNNETPCRCVEIDGAPARNAKGNVTLNLAHLCDEPGCQDPEHLRAFCQRCHLWYYARTSFSEEVAKQRRRKHNHNSPDERGLAQRRRFSDKRV